MAQDNVRQLADWLEENMTAIIDRKVSLNVSEIFCSIRWFWCFE